MVGCRTCGRCSPVLADYPTCTLQENDITQNPSRCCSISPHDSLIMTLGFAVYGSALARVASGGAPLLASRSRRGHCSAADPLSTQQPHPSTYGSIVCVKREAPGCFCKRELMWVLATVSSPQTGLSRPPRWGLFSLLTQKWQLASSGGFRGSSARARAPRTGRVHAAAGVPTGMALIKHQGVSPASLSSSVSCDVRAAPFFFPRAPTSSGPAVTPITTPSTLTLTASAPRMFGLKAFFLFTVVSWSVPKSVKRRPHNPASIPSPSRSGTGTVKEQ